MLSVDDALQLVLSQVRTLGPRNVRLADALGCVLAESVVSDIDSPPHDKSIVDGYAIIAASIMPPPKPLVVIEEVTAGAVPQRKVEPGTATRIMTGAPLPNGADAVVMVEQTRLEGDQVAILQPTVKPGQNIMRRAASMSRGQTVLQAGKVIRPIEAGLLAEVGCAEADVVPRPTVSVLATGNELVEHAAHPASGQIRNSNGPMLAALAQAAGIVVTSSQIARDTEVDLRRAIEAGLRGDVLVISGGVSAGVLDLVPKVLGDLGVEQVFHKVDLKPGKPLWFGVRRHATGNQTLVFGLPGNPVSSLVCFELFVRPAIQKLRGLPPTGLRRTTARLTCDHQQRGDRPTYWPARLADHGVTPLAWQGSGDLRTLADANCLAFFPGGERLFGVGETVEVRVLSDPNYE
jgi:molybdopterin molybdotransferase